jgi:ketosteroid isomerase-like protein
MSSATPPDVLAWRRRLILNGDADGFAGLLAPDAVIELPFAGPPGMPARPEGREAVRANARRVMASPPRLEDFEVESAGPRVLEGLTREPRAGS